MQSPQMPMGMPVPGKRKNCCKGLKIFAIILGILVLGLACLSAMLLLKKDGERASDSGNVDENSEVENELGNETENSESFVETDFNAASPTAEQIRKIVLAQDGWDYFGTSIYDIRVGKSNVGTFEWMAAKANDGIGGVIFSLHFYRRELGHDWIYSPNVLGQTISECSRLNPNERNAFSNVDLEGFEECMDDSGNIVKITPAD